MKMRVAVRTLLASLAFAAACSNSDDGPLAVGTLERDRLELVAEAHEPIVEILVREGASVTAGQPLLRLDDVQLRSQVAQATAARDRTRARLDELVRGPRPERIAEARAQLAGAEGAMVTQRREIARSRTLARAGSESASRLDLAQAQYDEALARRDAARATLDALLHGTTAEELAQARAALGEAEAALAVIRVSVERLVVRAPRPGRLDALPYKLGERPPAGAVVVVVLADGAPYARVFVPESARLRITPGVAATVRVDGTTRAFVGRVRTVSSEATFTPYFALTERDRSRLAYPAEVELTEGEARDLPTGIPVTVTFEAVHASAADTEATAARGTATTRNRQEDRGG
jgi:HlyD family secretion protein